ncbi:MAG: type II secretion system F family protein [Tepidisphaeraceae bacterium]
MMDNDKIAKLLIQLSVFGIVIAVWMAGTVVWMLRRSRRQRKLERRLHFAQQGVVDDERVIRLFHDGSAVDTFVPDTARLSWGERLERMRQDAGWQTPMPKVLALVATCITGAAALTWVVSGRWLPVICIVCVMVIGFRAFLFSRINKRTGLFEKQLIEALDLGGRSLRAGHPLNGAFKLIASEIGAPVSVMFSDIIEQEALGVSLQRALFNASQKSRSPDMKIFATSVVIQLRTGGNLADMIDRVAWVVRERMRLNRRARVLTAEAQLSKWVLLALPIGMFVLLNLINPEYMEPFYTTFLGKVMLVIAVVMLAIGCWVMNRMATLKY